jgi:F-type H+-transporting ATPase subunit b
MAVEKAPVAAEQLTDTAEHIETTAEVVENKGALASLGIEPMLFVAQLVNFAIILFVMWKWVYVPLLKTLDERTKKIEQGLKDATDAGSAKAEAEKERDALIGTARQESKRIIEEATKAAEAERAETVEKAKAEVARVVTQGKERLAAEQVALIASVRAEAATLVTLATEKILREKLDSKSDAKLVADSLKDA